jgi:hypothetical protein
MKRGSVGLKNGLIGQDLLRFSAVDMLQWCLFYAPIVALFGFPL